MHVSACFFQWGYICLYLSVSNNYLLLFFVIVTAFATDSCTSLGSKLISPNTLIHTPCLSISSLDKGNKHSDYRQWGEGGEGKEQYFIMAEGIGKIII